MLVCPALCCGTSFWSPARLPALKGQGLVGRVDGFGPFTAGLAPLPGNMVGWAGRPPPGIWDMPMRNTGVSHARIPSLRTDDAGIVALVRVSPMPPRHLHDRNPH